MNEIEELTTRVRKAMQQLGEANVKADSVWLSKDKHPLVEAERQATFLGLDVRFHDHSEEFVAALRFGRVIPLS